MPTDTDTHVIPAAQWAAREAAADRLAAEAVDFFDPEAGEAAWWHITGWPRSIVEGAEVTTCREWLVVKAPQHRIHAFYDRIKGRRIVCSWSADGNRSTFTPAS